jgi:nucleoid DNA-binding protein
MKRSDIVRSIQVKFKRLSAADAGGMMNAVVSRLNDALVVGDRVEIRGFGTFQTRRHAAKNTTDPRTGAPLHLPARRAVLFRPSRELVKKMN